MSVSNFTKTDNSTSIYLYATVAGASNPVISNLVHNSSGSGSAGGLKIGRSAYARAEVNNITGTIYAKVSISG